MSAIGWEPHTVPGTPPRTYYHNTATGESQWVVPIVQDSPVGSEVFVPDIDEGYVKAPIIKVEGLKVTVDLGYTHKKVDLSKCEKAHEDADHSDLVHLEDVNRATILDTLKLRYERDDIYTWVGENILVAMNPFKRLPLYTPEIIETYKNYAAKEHFEVVNPHSFCIADEAYMGLLDTNLDQSILISGESGAGKTETTKQCLAFLSERAGGLGAVGRQVIASSPILEAFGNAKTVHNDNSSRFGKFIQLNAEANTLKLKGCVIETYLLEKSRVTTKNPAERSFHALYQVLVGPPPKHLKEMGLTDVDATDFEITKSCYPDQVALAAEEQSYHAEYLEVITAFDDLQIPDSERQPFFHLVAACLHLGNIEFEEPARATNEPVGSVVTTASEGHLQMAGKLLGIDPKSLAHSLVHSENKIIAQRSSETIRVVFNVARAESARNSLARDAFKRNFASVVARVNSAMSDGSKPGYKDRRVGLLDIFGFEILEVNGFEQLCINYCNEWLQQHFNRHVFELESKLYEDEGLDFKMPAWKNNQEVLNLIQAKPSGLLVMLDDEVFAPGGSDERYVSKIDATHASNSIYQSSVQMYMESGCFSVVHFAGKVTYTVVEFISKNRDTMSESLLDLCLTSESEHVRGLYAGENVKADNKSSKRLTQGAAFKKQLAELMKTLQDSRPQYIRCIKSNAAKKARLFSAPMILDQLTYAGVFEAASIRKQGFPFRRERSEFWRRFRCLGLQSPQIKKTGVKPTDDMAACTLLLKYLSDERGIKASAGVQFGKTMCLYRTVTNAVLEAFLSEHKVAIALVMTSVAQGAMVRKRMRDVLDAEEVILQQIVKRDLPALDAAVAHVATLTLARAYKKDVKACADTATWSLNVEKEAELTSVLADVTEFEAELRSVYSLAAETREKDPPAFKTKEWVAVLKGGRGATLLTTLTAKLKHGDDLAEVRSTVDLFARWEAAPLMGLVVEDAWPIEPASAKALDLLKARIVREEKYLAVQKTLKEKTEEGIKEPLTVALADLDLLVEVNAEDDMPVERAAALAMLEQIKKEEIMLKAINDALTTAKYDAVLVTEVISKGETLPMVTKPGKNGLATCVTAKTLESAYSAALASGEESWKAKVWQEADKLGGAFVAFGFTTSPWANAMVKAMERRGAEDRCLEVLAAACLKLSSEEIQSALDLAGRLEGGPQSTALITAMKDASCLKEKINAATLRIESAMTSRDCDELEAAVKEAKFLDSAESIHKARVAETAAVAASLRTAVAALEAELVKVGQDLGSLEKAVTELSLLKQSSAGEGRLREAAALLAKAKQCEAQCVTAASEEQRTSEGISKALEEAGHVNKAYHALVTSTLKFEEQNAAALELTKIQMAVGALMAFAKAATIILDEDDMAAAIAESKKLRFTGGADLKIAMDFVALPEAQRIRKQLEIAVQFKDEPRKIKLTTRLKTLFYEALDPSDTNYDLTNFVFLQDPVKWAKKHEGPMLEYTTEELKKTLTTRYLDWEAYGVQVSMFDFNGGKHDPLDRPEPRNTFELLAGEAAWLLGADSLKEKAVWLECLEAAWAYSRNEPAAKWNSKISNDDTIARKVVLKTGPLRKRARSAQSSAPWKQRWFQLELRDGKARLVFAATPELLEAESFLTGAVIDLGLVSKFETNDEGTKYMSDDKVLMKPKEMKNIMQKLTLKASKIFSSIQIVMGDRPGIYREQNVQVILEAGLETSELADEIYVMLLKQLTNNSSVASCDAGWRLLSLCLGVFPPSDELAKYVEYYLHKNEEQHLLMKLSIILEDGAVAEMPDPALVKQAFLTDDASLKPFAGGVRKNGEKKKMRISLYNRTATVVQAKNMRAAAEDSRPKFLRNLATHRHKNVGTLNNLQKRNSVWGERGWEFEKKRAVFEK